jgi:PAS domain S-box-containing protein
VVARLIRRWNDTSLRVKGIVVIGIPMIPLVVSAALFLLGARNAGTANDLMARANQAESQIATVLGLVVESESGVSEFLLTRDIEALRPFQAAGARLPAAVEQLRALVWDHPDQVAHVQAIARLTALRPLAPIVDAAERGLPLPNPAPLLAERRATTAKLRNELDAMLTRQNQLIADRAAVLRRVLTALAVGGAVFGLLFGGLAMLAFVSGVTRGVDRLRDDMSRLAHGEALTPLVPAGDEVGELAAGIREAARMIQARDAQVTAQVAALAEMNRDLELARNELDQFFSLSLDPMGIAGSEGKFLRVNAAWERTLGWTESEITSTPFLELVHPDDVRATAAEAAKLADGGLTVSFENRYRGKNGSYRWLNWSAVSTPERGLLYCAARDVTEQKRVAADLQRHASELSAANDELEAFSYSVSHDLRAPLRHVTGFANLLQRSAAARLSHTEQRHVRTIIDAATRMGRLIDDLLAFSRMGRTAVNRQRIGLDTVFDEAMHELDGAATGSAVAWTIQRPLPAVDGDPALLRQVFVNLLSNAVKYAGGGTTPAVEVGAMPAGGDETVLFVRDNGVGFDMQYAHKLFGVFQRLHSSDDFEGTGIGLANVRRIVQRHGGRVWAEGAVGVGATFFFSLPNTGAPS